MEIRLFDRNYNLIDLQDGIKKNSDIPDRVGNHFGVVKKQYLGANDRLAVELSISEEGQEALRNKLEQMKGTSACEEDIKVFLPKTNEVAWEHYTAMRTISSQTLRDGNYSVEDLMKSIMEAYETVYHKIVEEHKNGDRQISSPITGTTTVSLEEDLAGLDAAFQGRLANLAGMITCQQTNEAFKNPDSEWYFRRIGLQRNRKTEVEEKKTEQEVKTFDMEYHDTMLSIMKRAQQEFLDLYKSQGYQKGTAVGILTDMLKWDNKNSNDREKFR